MFDNNNKFKGMVKGLEAQFEYLAGCFTALRFENKDLRCKVEALIATVEILEKKLKTFSDAIMEEVNRRKEEKKK